MLFPSTFETTDVRGKTVLLRVDFNIPPTAKGGLMDTFRLHAHAPTIRALQQRGARVVLLTHRGRPNGKPDANLSTLPLVQPLSDILSSPVTFAADCIGRPAETATQRLQEGEVLLLENTRFHMGEQLNENAFAQALAKLGDVYINDAAAAAHRPHASLSRLASCFENPMAGPRLLAELAWIRRAIHAPSQGKVYVLAGTQVGEKIELLRHIISQGATIMLAGSLAYTFLAARDMGLGLSSINPAYVPVARDILAEAGVLGCRMLLPTDMMVHTPTTPQTRMARQLLPTDNAMDIGPQTLATWSKVIQQASSVVWMGTLGNCQSPVFREGTLGLARTLAQTQAFSLLGGESLLEALHHAGLRDSFPHLASGSAMMMHSLMERPLPALIPLHV